ncbi:disease resistance protein RGA5-like [Miscanthus floridulus]|uniref:disease resistance protein RGA5-like n=1 Tax=Miscanthus floridulus TaxID=154761 RepID=UPI003459A075
MEFATGALGTLLPKLGKLLQDEYNLQNGVKKDIEFVTRELESMRAALRDVGEVPQEQLKEVVKIWARDVRELSYDMEDIVDTFLVRVQGSEPLSKRSVRRFIKKMTSIVSTAKTHHEIVQETKDIKERVKEVAERRDRYKVDAITPAKTSADPRITALYTKAASLVGIDEPREELISRLTKEDGGMMGEQMIISIVGFGGLGKTTLAKAVYDKIKPQFNCTAFVSVSRDPNIIKIFKDMLYDLDKKEYKDIHNAALGQQHLTDLVQEFLKNKRYLIVIDDIWDTKPWEMIRCAVPENDLKCRVLTTTRRIDVAEHVGGCYMMKPLTHNSSKILFYGRIFGSIGNCPQQFSVVSEKVLKKCGGVPLAIVTISSLLANKSRNVNEWCDVCDAIGTGIGNNPGMDDMRKILLLSYYDLTPQLKTCLLYLSLFPEDYEIVKSRLIFRWIAEGFVQQGHGMKSLFEIGQSYFNELLNRSLIQPGDIDEEDYVSPLSCRVHDMVFDLICSVSRDESFATTVYGDSKQITSSESKVRRLSIHSTSCPKMNTSKLRSLTIKNPAIINSMPPLSCYHLLCVLDLQYCDLNDHPSLDFVGKLFHLRYLSLADTRYAGEVPREIGKLQFLQTFILRGTGIKEVPLSIFELGQLMCFVVGDSTRLPTSGLGNLSSLKHLRMNVDSVYIAEELGHLTHLRVLYVVLTKDKEGRWDESMCRVLVGSLGKLLKIQTLGVEISNDVAVDLEGSVDSLSNLYHLLIYGTSRLPTWINPASFLLLSHLHIIVAQVRREDIQVLGMLQVLRVLELHVAGTKQVFERFMISADAFPCVTRCEFSGFSMVPSIFPPGAMPRLRRFVFHIRPEDFGDTEFTDDDLTLSHLPSLQTVWVHLDGEETISEEMAMKVKETLKNEARANPNHRDIRIRIDDEWIQLCM